MESFDSTNDRKRLRDNASQPRKKLKADHAEHISICSSTTKDTYDSSEGLQTNAVNEGLAQQAKSGTCSSSHRQLFRRLEQSPWNLSPETVLRDFGSTGWSSLRFLKLLAKLAKLEPSYRVALSALMCQHEKRLSGHVHRKGVSKVTCWRPNDVAAVLEDYGVPEKDNDIDDGQSVSSMQAEAGTFNEDIAGVVYAMHFTFVIDEACDADLLSAVQQPHWMLLVSMMNWHGPSGASFNMGHRIVNSADLHFTIQAFAVIRPWSQAILEA